MTTNFCMLLKVYAHAQSKPPGVKVKAGMATVAAVTCEDVKRPTVLCEPHGPLSDLQREWMCSSSCLESLDSPTAATDREHEECTCVVPYGANISRARDEKLTLRLSWEADSIW